VKLTTMAGAALLLVPGGLHALQAAAPEEKAAVPEREMGLSRTTVFETPSPPVAVEDATDPGERPALPRVYAGTPPLVPHGVADMLPITRDDNMCLACHQLEERVEGMPTPVPRSHYVDLRHAPKEIRDEVAGARYVCSSCHVAQTDALPLVGNRFSE
jgi:cytochrome c-type protein NapB